MHSPTNVKIEAPTINLTGAVVITGTITATGNASFTGTMANNGKNISETHTHGGVQTGSGTTGVVS